MLMCIFLDRAESNIKVPSNFNDFDIYVCICAYILCLCIFGYRCMHTARKKENVAMYMHVSLLIYS